MQISFNLASIVLFMLIAQGAFAAPVLFFRNENRKANKYLSLLILLLSLWLCDSFFRVSGIYSLNPNFYFLPIYFSLGFGPLIYCYTGSLTKQDFKLDLWKALHFLPVLLQLLFYLFLQGQDYPYRREFWLNVHKPYTYDLELILSFASILVYLLASLKQIRAYKQEIENNFSNLDRIKLNWLRSIHIVLSLLALLWLFEALARLILVYYPITPLSSITIGFTIVFMAAGGVLQQDLSVVTDALQPVAEDQKEEKLVPAVNPEVLARIQLLMAEKELFLNQELSLREFAQQVGLPAREVSRTINQGLGVTFIDFVNQYRIARFKVLVQKKEFDHLSLVGLALESGFNSKSTFNRVFKKVEGKSPSALQKEAQNRN